MTWHCGSCQTEWVDGYPTCPTCRRSGFVTNISDGLSQDAYQRGYRKGAADCAGSVDKMDKLEAQRDAAQSVIRAFLDQWDSPGGFVMADDADELAALRAIVAEPTA